MKAKIKSIRAQYTREKQKSSKVKTGTGTDEVYVSKWPHLEQLKFLDDFIIAKKSISNLSVVSKVLYKSIPVDQANDIYIHIIYVLCIIYQSWSPTCSIDTLRSNHVPLPRYRSLIRKIEISEVISYVFSRI